MTSSRWTRGIVAVMLLPLVLAPSVARAATGSGTPGAVGWSAPTLAQVAATESATGLQPAAIGVFADFTTAFPAAWAAEARRRAVPLVIAWEPWDWSRVRADQPEYSAAAIAAGRWDAYARSFASDARASGATVLLRFAPEMNGDWNLWSQGPGDSPADFVRAWRHLHAIFTDIGAANVAWVFNPSVRYEGSTAIRRYWPGAASVDWLALDGYHWHGVLPGFTHQTAADVFAPSLAELRALDARAPFMIAETAAPPAEVADWLADVQRTAPALGARLVLWFEFDKEVDWRLASALPRAAASPTLSG
jgi:hypothetical protein